MAKALSLTMLECEAEEKRQSFFLFSFFNEDKALRFNLTLVSRRMKP